MTTVSDPVAGYAGFAAALREAGVACDAHRVQAYLTAVAEIDVAEPTQLYWAGRLTLCSSPDDLPCYEEAFSQWFSIETTTPKRATSAAPKKARIAPLAAAEGADAEGGEGADQLKVAASAHEVLRHRDLAELTTAEREHLRELLATLKPTLPRRPAESTTAKRSV